MPAMGDAAATGYGLLSKAVIIEARLSKVMTPVLAIHPDSLRFELSLSRQCQVYLLGQLPLLVRLA